MRICAFSDIHGNGAAFRVAYKMLMQEGADLNLFLGDICGYYFDQLEIFEKLRLMPNLICLKGNHDETFRRISKGDSGARSEYLSKYGMSMEFLLNADHSELVNWLGGLPESSSLPEFGMSFFHGCPWSKLEGYVYPDSGLDCFLDYADSKFLLGHTHYKMKRGIGDKSIFNPGSLGQPRDGGWPSYAVFDMPGGDVEFKEVPYDRAGFIEQVKKKDPSKNYLVDVLLRSR
jgi:predicted phosphodiesterase